MTWPKPELSVGQKCEHQPIGSTFYEATGPALETFEKVAPIIFKIVEVSKLDLERGIPSSPSAEIRLFMISRNKIPFIFATPALELSIKKQARPTIVVLSTSKLYRKRVVALLRKDKQLEKHPEFEFAGFSRDPAEPMATATYPRLETEIGGIYVDGNSCVEPGVSLIFSTGRRATLGGIITINEKKYGVTAYHASIGPNPIREEPNDSLSESDDDSSLDFDDFELEHEDITLQKSDIETFASPSHKRALQIEFQIDGSNLRKIGTISSGHFSRELDYLVFPLESSHGWSDSKTIRSMQRFRPVTEQLKTEERQVWAMTGTTGNIAGVILCKTHYMKMPWNSGFQKMWAVRLNRKTLPGDSGAWIMDRITNQFYGHIVAGDPNSCLAFIVPAYKLSYDIDSWFDTAVIPVTWPQRWGHVDQPTQVLNEGEMHKDIFQIYRQQLENKRVLAAKIERFSFWRRWKDFLFHPKVKTTGLPTQWKVSYPQYDEDEAKVRSRIQRESYSAIEGRPCNTRVFLVAASGIFANSYTSTSSKIVLPLLAYVYWDSDWPQGLETILAFALLTGSVVGQLIFGVLADFLGRRRLYGLELVVTICATLGIVNISQGSGSSLGIIGWLSIWRFLLGVGIGVEYPLSATITSEWAPCESRSRMLATVFYMRLIAPFVASLAAGAVLVSIDRLMVPVRWGLEFKTPESTQIVDVIWRVVMGVGAIPAVVAIWFRLSIPETPRYTVDVANDLNNACRDFQNHPTHNAETFGNQSSMRASGRICDEFEDMAVNANLGAKASLLGFIDFIFRQGYWRPLIATSLSWFFLDFTLHGLSINSPTIALRVWQNGQHFTTTIYSDIIGTSYQSLILVITGSILGACIMLKVLPVWTRRKIQLQLFLGLVIFFMALGIHTYIASWQTHIELILLLYLFCLALFNLGPNLPTFILPAEIFPTRFRATCHGITAASGTLGCIVAQLFFTTVKFGGRSLDDPDLNTKWLRSALVLLSIFITLGTVVTWFWIPETCDDSGKSKSLEELSVGCHSFVGRSRERDSVSSCK